MKAKAEKTQKAERDANSKSSTGTNNKIENQMTNQITNLSIKCDDEDSREEDAEELTPDEAEALKQLLASDAASGEDGAGCRDQTDHGNSSGDGENADASACGEQGEESSDETRNGESKKNPDHNGESKKNHARLERQVFVGGLPVDVTSTLFRTWADEVFTGHVINAVLVVDRETHSRSRGFGFITFDAVEVAEESAQQRMFAFGDRMVEIKRAQNLNSNRKKQAPQAAAESARGSARGAIKPAVQQNGGRTKRPTVATVGDRGVGTQLNGGARGG